MFVCIRYYTYMYYRIMGQPSSISSTVVLVSRRSLDLLVQYAMANAGVSGWLVVGVGNSLDPVRLK